jgi:hypothetical protein
MPKTVRVETITKRRKLLPLDSGPSSVVITSTVLILFGNKRIIFLVPKISAVANRR